MNVLLKIAIFFLKILYFFFKLLPTQNKITMISRQSDKITIDFDLLSKEILKRGNYKVVVLTHKLKPGLKNKLKYIFHMVRQMYHIATSKVVILDSYCIVISLLTHKKSLVVIQMWHAMGSLKKFGYSIVETNTSTSAFEKQMSVERKKEINKIMRMHKGYDCIFASSEFCAPYFAEAFGYNIDKMVVMPLPIVDLLLDSKYRDKVSKEIKNIYPVMKEKENIIYVPTFRPAEKEESIQELIDSINYEKYNLIIKLHPLTHLKNHDERVIWDKHFTSREMMMASDYIITDYSAIVYEASLLEKPIYFYIYDYDEYSKERNFYIDFKKELPGFMSEKANDIIQKIEKREYDIEQVIAFAHKNISLTEQSACERIVHLIDSLVLEKNKI